MEILEFLRHLGPNAPVVFVAAYILATVCFLPGSFLTLGAGVLFGVVKGCLLVSVGSVLGASGAFLVGRYLVRNWVTSKVQDNPRFKAIDTAVADQAFKIVFLIRLSPVFPFNLTNYAMGLTSVRFKDYVLASWLGMIPGTVMYVYLGSVLGEAALATTGHRSKTPLEWALYGVGLLATVMVTVIVTRIAKKALAQKIK